MTNVTNTFVTNTFISKDRLREILYGYDEIWDDEDIHDIQVVRSEKDQSIVGINIQIAKKQT